MASSSSSSSRYASSSSNQGRTNNPPKTVRKKKKNKKVIPRKRLLTSKGGRGEKNVSVGRLSTTPRRLLTDYESIRGSSSKGLENEQQRRLQQALIGCPHYDECSGCVVDGNVAQVALVRSARRFFTSKPMRQKRIGGGSKSSDYSRDKNDDDDDDGFFEVVVPSAVTQWRTQAKLAVAPKPPASSFFDDNDNDDASTKSSSNWSKDGCVFGLYRRGTHQVLSIPDCAVHHPSINRAVQALERATARAGITAYQSQDDRGGKSGSGGGGGGGGRLRYVQLQVERTNGRVCLTLVWHAEQLKDTQPAQARLLKELQKIEPELWHSIWCHCNDSPGNNIFSRNPRRWTRMMGPEFLREPIPVGEYGWLHFTPLVFRQGNLNGFDIVATDVAKLIPPGSKVCELYAGVGVLGLTAFAYHHHRQHQEGDGMALEWLRCSDENPSNPRCFQRALESLPFYHGRERKRRKRNDELDSEDGGEMTLAELAAMVESENAGSKPRQSRNLVDDERYEEMATYMVASAADALRRGQALGAEVLVVDPPRKGLEDEVLNELCKPYNPEQPYVERADYLMVPEETIHWTNDVQTLIYVSCGFDALARDTEMLVNGPGGWMLAKATGYVLFPGSDHVETVCLFVRD